MHINCNTQNSLTVAPESLRLCFYILEVDVKILPRGSPETGVKTTYSEIRKSLKRASDLFSTFRRVESGYCAFH